MTNWLTIGEHNIALAPDVAISINFYFYAAITENTFGDDSYHINTIYHFTGNKGRWFVIGIGCSRTNCRKKLSLPLYDITNPILGSIFTQKGYHFMTQLNNG